MKRAFSFIELAVVILIISVFTVVAISGLNYVRAKSRDTKRLGDVSEIQTALLYYYQQNSIYPQHLTSGASLIGLNGQTYMKVIPSAPGVNDGNCQSDNYTYSPSSDYYSYSLSYCLGGKASTGVGPGNCLAVPGSICELGTIARQYLNPTHLAKLLNGQGGASLNDPNRIVISGSNAFITTNVLGGTSSLEIVNISDPANPVHRAKLFYGEGGGTGAELRTPTDLFISGNYAYITSNSRDSLEILNISNPDAPTHVGKISDTTYLDGASSVSVSGNYAFVTSQYKDYLTVINISNKASPSRVTSLASGTGGADLSDPYEMEIAGNYAYIVNANTNSFEVVNISTPTAPAHTAKLSHNAAGPQLSAPLCVHISGNYAFVCSGGSDALEIIDIANPADPKHLGSLFHGADGAIMDAPTSIVVRGNYAYITQAYPSHALEIVDIANPANPVHAGKIAYYAGGPALGGAWSVALSGNYAFVAANTSDGLEVIDISH